MKKEIIDFFEKLHSGAGDYKLTTDSMLTTIKESNFSNEVKNELCDRVNNHVSCEFDDLHIDPFVVYRNGDLLVLECENCFTTIIDNKTLEKMV